MLRIEVTPDAIKIELWSGIARSRPNPVRIIPNNPVNLARLEAAIKERQARYLRVDEHDREGNTVYFTYNQDRFCKVVDGVYYDARMKNRLILALARARASGERVRLYWGDPVTGRAWGDVESGRVGRTGGMIKSPILVYNRRSYGGEIISKSIVKVEYANKKNGGVLYDITPEARTPLTVGLPPRLSYQYVRLADLIRAHNIDYSTVTKIGYLSVAATRDVERKYSVFHNFNSELPIHLLTLDSERFAIEAAEYLSDRAFAVYAAPDAEARAAAIAELTRAAREYVLAS